MLQQAAKKITIEGNSQLPSGMYRGINGKFSEVTARPLQRRVSAVAKTVSSSVTDHSENENLANAALARYLGSKLNQGGDEAVKVLAEFGDQALAEGPTHRTPLTLASVVPFFPKEALPRTL